jgi:hypothetical protein
MLWRAAILLAGLVLPQAVLCGPSLLGRKILLPLDLLAQPQYFLPRTAEYAGLHPSDYVLADEVLLFEFERRFAAAEFRAGRLPLWNPFIYLGAPFVVWEAYSPFNLPYYLFPDPRTLAWILLFKSLVAGVGAYLFFRQVLGVSFWPAAVGAWCYPLTGFFILWAGFPHSAVMAWLPWLFLATDCTLRRPLGWGGPALAVLTCLVLITRIDVAAQALLAVGLYALWFLGAEFLRTRGLGRLFAAGTAVLVGWTLGFVLAAPYLLPLAQYTRLGDRLLRRGEGQEERPPGGLYELPRVVLPEAYGATQYGAHMVVQGNLPESAASTYIGLVATLFLAPLAWCNRRQWSLNAFWVLLSGLALAWTLNLPVVVPLLRNPGINLLSHNRFVFVAAFALLALAVVGLDVVWQGAVGRHWWFALPVLALVLLGAWCWVHATRLPEPLATELEGVVRTGRGPGNVPDLAALARARSRYLEYQIYGVVLCALALCGWVIVLFGGTARGWFRPVLVAFLLGELVCFAFNRNPQCDPSLYYPPLPVLEQLAAAPPGRVLGYNCLPADLAMSHGLHDIRGYDSVDPRPVVELLDLARDPRAQSFAYARLQWYFPRLYSRAGKVLPPPVLNLLNVRYLIVRGPPPPDIHPRFVAPDYCAFENEHALPRAFVPRRVEQAPSPKRLLTLLGAADFDPRLVAYVEGAVSLPGSCRGTATVFDRSPTHVTVNADMETAGLLVLSDLWYEGWNAYRDGESVPILRTDHALRGVVLPAGLSTVEFRYKPVSYARGVWLMLGGLVGLCVWIALGQWFLKT